MNPTAKTTITTSTSKGWGIGTQIMLLCSGAVFVAIILVGGLALWNHYQHLRNRILVNSAQTGERLINIIDRQIFERYQNLNMWSQQPVLQDLEIDDVDGQITNFLQQAHSGYSAYRELLAVNLDNRIVAASNARHLNTATPEEIWQGQVVAGSRVYMSGVVSGPFSRKPTLIFRAGVYSTSDAKPHLLGALVALLDWRQINGLLDETRFESKPPSPEHLVLLLNQEDQVIAIAGMAIATFQNKYPVTDLIKQIAKKNFGEVAVGNNSFIFGAARSRGYEGYPGFSWRTVILHDRQTVFRPVFQNLMMLVVIGIAGTAGFSFVVSRLATRFAEPIDRVSAAMRKVQEGDFSMTISNRYTGELGRLVQSLNFMTAGLREREMIRNTFRRYVSSSVADTLIQEGKDGQINRAQRVKATILFSDVRGFTSLSEKLSPEETVRILNLYFSKMVEIVFSLDGTLDKFIGDGLMAVWGVPVPQPNQAELASRAAFRMQQAMADINKQLEEQGLPKLRIGVGVNSGEVVAGSIGSSERLEYTVIGDEVNLASRCEELTKTMNAGVLLTENTQALLPENFTTTFLQEILIRGKQIPVKIFSLNEIDDSGEKNGTA